MRTRSLEALAGMGIPPTRFKQYPHEFSGGMRQRIMIALALVLRPKRGRRRRADHGARRDRRGADPRDPGRPAAELRHGAAPDHAQPRHRRRGLRPGGRDVRGQDRRGGRRAAGLLRSGAPVHARAAALDHLAADHRPPLHPGRAAEPDRPAAGVPLPSALPGRDDGMRRARTRSRSRTDARPAGRVLAPRPRGRDPGGRHRAARARARSRSRRRHEYTELRRASWPYSRCATCIPATRCAARSSTGCAGARPARCKAVDGVSFEPGAGRGAGDRRRVGLRARRPSGGPCFGLVEAERGLDQAGRARDRRPQRDGTSAICAASFRSSSRTPTPRSTRR